MMNGPSHRIAVIHPRLLPGGGSEASAAWTLQALQDDFRLTLITMESPDLPVLDATYGTSLDPERIEIQSLSVPFGTRRRFDALRMFRLARHVRRCAGQFDAVISAYGLFDLGRRGIQRVGDFSFDDRLRRQLHGKAQGRTGVFHRGSVVRSLYLALGRALSGGSPEAWKKDLIVANSEWTRDLLMTRFGVPSRVVYPPVAGETSEVPWSERADGFVLLARLVPEKGILQVVDVLRQVRRERDVHLHVLGRRDDPAHFRELERVRRDNAGWIFLEGEAYGADKARILAGHKYGISGCRQEAFGMAVAEMVKAGCIVWVPNGGGQTEVVAHAELIYEDPEEAAAKILRILGDPEKQRWVRNHLRARAGQFSAARFVREMRAVVRSFLEETHAGGS
jgi:glycosyltransferase involved in cell wall biosynthesis